MTLSLPHDTGPFKHVSVSKVLHKNSLVATPKTQSGRPKERPLCFFQLREDRDALLANFSSTTNPKGCVNIDERSKALANSA